MVMRSAIVLIFIAALVMSSEIAYGTVMLLVIGEGNEVRGSGAKHLLPKNNWREAHINGAQRARKIGPVVLPVLLLAAGVLSFIAPEENGSGEDFWEDNFF